MTFPEPSAQYVEDVDAAELLNEVSKIARACGVLCQVLQVEQEHPHEAIIEVAVREKCDLIVMASHGRRGLAAVLLGSVTAKVLAHTTVPVLFITDLTATLCEPSRARTRASILKPTLGSMNNEGFKVGDHVAGTPKRDELAVRLLGCIGRTWSSKDIITMRRRMTGI